MKQLTHAAGAPVADNQNIQTAGPRGPALLQDVWLIEKLAHFNREVIPERRMHAKGSGAFGSFTVTHDISQWTKASLFGAVGLVTPVLARFSTVAGERGAADAERDIRGFALKFYTAQGNWDLVGNNTPVFFMRDPLRFPDIGVVYDVAVDTDAFVVHPLHEERIAVFAKQGAFGLEASGVDIQELSRLPLLLPPRPYALRRVLERECGRELHPVAECSTADLVLRLASLGVGVGVLPELMPREMVEGCGLRRLSLLGGKISRRVVAITRTGEDKSLLIGDALGALRQTLQH